MPLKNINKISIRFQNLHPRCFHQHPFKFTRSLRIPWISEALHNCWFASAGKHDKDFKI